MMKRIVCLLLCGILVLIGVQCYAGTGVQHEDDLELALLGRKLSEKSKNPDLSNDSKAVLFGYLEDAIYLCIDQSGSDGQKWLDELNNTFQVPDLPKSIFEFSVPKNDDHQAYTHMGWDFDKYEEKAKWKVRQNILLATVNKVFGFPLDEGKTGNDRYCKECVAMSKLIYYIHILRDHIENAYDNRLNVIQLSKMKDDYGHLQEINDCIDELFSSQRTSNKYCRLKVRLTVIRTKSRFNGQDDTEAKQKKVIKYAKEALECLQNNLPGLLQNTGFFSAVFN